MRKSGHLKLGEHLIEGTIINLITRNLEFLILSIDKLSHKEELSDREFQTLIAHLGLSQDHPYNKKQLDYALAKQLDPNTELPYSELHFDVIPNVLGYLAPSDLNYLLPSIRGRHINCVS